MTKGQKVYIWKNDELKRYKDYLDIQQITFGKQCRIMLLKNGKVWAEGRNKARHLLDNEAEVCKNALNFIRIADVKGVEIPFYEKKDRIIYLSSFF